MWLVSFHSWILTIQSLSTTSTGLWRWYINITITILDIIHRPVFSLKYNVSETGFFLRLEVEPSQMGLSDELVSVPRDRANLCLRTPATTPIRFITVDCSQLSRFHLKTHSSPRNVVFQIKDRKMDNVQNCKTLTTQCFSYRTRSLRRGKKVMLLLQSPDSIFFNMACYARVTDTRLLRAVNKR
jgi:hypothetical protein